MENVNPGQTQPVAVAGSDWRDHLLIESRQRIIFKIMETLKRHFPFDDKENMNIAVRFEEKTYNAARSQSDYLRRISMNMLDMETKSQNSFPNSLPSSAGSSSRSPVFEGEYRHEVPTCNTKGVFGDLTLVQPADVPIDIKSRNWRAQLLPSSRQRIVEKIAKTLEKYLPVSSKTGLKEVSPTAIKIEENIYNAATSEFDYLRKISVNMLMMETTSQKNLPNSLGFDDASNSDSPEEKH